MLIHTELAPGHQTIFAINRQDVGNMISALAIGNMKCREILKVSKDIRESFPVTWFEFAGDLNETPVLSLMIGPDGRLDFLLRRGMATQMLRNHYRRDWGN